MTARRETYPLIGENGLIEEFATRSGADLAHLIFNQFLKVECEVMIRDAEGKLHFERRTDELPQAEEA